MVGNRLTFRTKLHQHSTNRTAEYILSFAAPLVQYSWVSQPRNELNTFGVPCAVGVPKASTECNGIHCSNRQQDPLNLVSRDLFTSRYLHIMIISGVYLITNIIPTILLIIFRVVCPTKSRAQAKVCQLDVAISID